jgi:formylglycine-generating enzyme required for sulfatase activity
VIEQKLDEAKCIIVLWSKMSIQSNWVKTEATEGNNRGILFPVLIEDVKVPLAFRRIQAANLVDWQGIPDHPQFQLLLRSVTEILGHPSSPPEKPKKEETPEETETFTNSIGMEFVLIPAGEFMMVSVV